MVVDLTADPFGEASLVVGAPTRFHESLDEREERDVSEVIAALDEQEADRYRRFLGPIEMSTTIRLGVPTDATALAELAARTFRDTFAADNRPGDIAQHMAHAYGSLQQGRELSDPNIVTLLAQGDEELTGYAQLRCGPAPACVEGNAPIELWRLYVAQGWHGQGIARTLMRRVDAEADRVGARTLWLGVWERNERAKAFYRKGGFVDIGAHVFMVGADAQTDRIMARSVAPGREWDTAAGGGR